VDLGTDSWEVAHVVKCFDLPVHLLVNLHQFGLAATAPGAGVAQVRNAYGFDKLACVWSHVKRQQAS